MDSFTVETTMTPHQPTDNLPALVAEAQANPGMFAGLYDRFVQPVYRYLYRQTRNQADAEDLTAQTFLAALESLPRYQEEGHFAAWLFAIARSKAMNYFRTGQPQVPLESLEELSGEGDLLGRVVKNGELAQLSALIEALNQGERELIYLRYVADLSFSEMAVVLKKTEGAIKKALYRLQTRLQSQMEARHE